MSLFTEMIALLESLTLDSNIAFIASFVLILISFTLFFQKRKHAIFFLFLAGVSIGVGFALIDPFLHFWDEKPHALVAKNLAQTPFHPRFMNSDLVNYDYKSWINNYTWLHKPPLALWQMALSIKLFGASVLAVRIPSIILHALTSVLVYRIGVNVFTRNIGYFAALTYLLMNYNLALVAGVHTADHVDASFTFYITASIWAFIKYQKSRETKWVYLIGCFVGLAILTKWLVGLLVFSGWGVYLIIYYKDNSLVEWKRMMTALIVSLLVSAPWFIYTYLRFPAEFQYEMVYNTLHFSQAVEGHGGGSFYYWNNLNILFGDELFIPWLMLLSFLLIWITVNEKKYALFFYVWITIVYLFFTLANTKMTGFVNIVSPLLVLSAVAVILKVWSLFRSKINFNRILLYSLNTLLLLILFVAFLRPFTVRRNHFLIDQNIRHQIINKKNFIKNNIPGKPKDIYFFEENPFYSNIDVMFYHPSTAVDRLPSDQEILKLSKQGYTLYIVYSNERPELNIKNPKLKYLKI
jgi:4-amino-4-deoxy-L-arabinose transferase-like glycosyltransferase